MKTNILKNVKKEKQMLLFMQFTTIKNYSIRIVSGNL